MGRRCDDAWSGELNMTKIIKWKRLIYVVQDEFTPEGRKIYLKKKKQE